MANLSTGFMHYLWDKVYLQCGSYLILRNTVADLIATEHALRQLTQREERLQYKIAALKKLPPASTGSDEAEFEEVFKQLQDTQFQYPRQEYALYQAISSLPESFKSSYHGLRLDTTWYMREGLVQDCKDQGGCCSRQCGCCAQTHLSKRNKGQGHCTLECRCYIESRGFEFSNEEKEESREHLVQRLKNISDSVYLARLGEWLLLPLEAPPKPEQKKKRSLGGDEFFTNEGSTAARGEKI